MGADVVGDVEGSRHWVRMWEATKCFHAAEGRGPSAVEEENKEGLVIADANVDMDGK